MTWGEFLNSEYNNGDFDVYINQIRYSGSNVYDVMETDLIIDGKVYDVADN